MKLINVYRIAWLVLTIAFSILLFIWDATVHGKDYQEFAANHSSTSGKIISSHSSHGCNVVYNFEVDNMPYTGGGKMVYPFDNRDPQGCEKILGQNIQIYYNTKKPAISNTREPFYSFTSIAIRDILGGFLLSALILFITYFNRKKP